MARLVFLLFFIIETAIAQSVSNESTAAASSESEAPSSDKLEASVQVSPSDIENNTGPFMRSESSLNRLLSLSNPNLPIEGSLNTDTLSIDNLANQLGVTVSEPNLLGNFNTEPNVQTNDPLLQQQSLDDYLNPNPLLENEGDSNQYKVNTLPLGLGQSGPLDTLESLLNAPTQNQNQYTTLTKVYKSPPILLPSQGNDQLLNSVQALLNQQSQAQNPGLTNVYQQPGTLLTETNDDQLLNTVKSIINQQSTKLNDYQVTDVNNVQGLNLGQSLLEQPGELGSSELNNVYQLLNQGSNPSQSLGLESLLGQDLSNLQSVQQTNQGDQYLASLLRPGNNNPNNLETRLVFKNPVPNLHLPNCKAAFGALIQSALIQYLRLAELPYCQQSGSNPFPTLNLPFEIIAVPSNTGWQSADHSVLTKILWILLNRLKNQPGPNQTDLITPILLELILKPVTAPSVDDNTNNLNVIPGQTQNLPFLLLLLKLLKNQSQTPSRQYLYKIIVDIIKKQSPNNPYDQNPENHDYPPYWIPPSSTPLPLVFPTATVSPIDINYPTTIRPYVVPTVYPTLPPNVFPTDYPHNLPTAYPTEYPRPPKVIPTRFEIPETTPLPIVETLPTDQSPTAIPDNPQLSKQQRYVILILQKYLPQQHFSVQDLTFLIQLVNTLPKTYNELVLNPQLLNQVILQLQQHNLNPQIVLAIIYKYLIQLSTQITNGQNVLLPDSNRVVLLKYQIKRQKPIVYQPYYYVLYKLPYAHFLKYLQQLLVVKPYLKQNRALLLKELLVLVLSSNSEISADFNGVSKEYLVQLISSQGATPLDVKVVNDNNVSYEQLKVLNDVQLGTNLPVISQTGDINFDLIGGSGTKVWETSGSNIWETLGQGAGTGSNVWDTLGTGSGAGSNLWAYLLQKAPVGQISNLPIDSNWQQSPVSQITNLPIDSNWQQDSVSQITNLPIDSNWQQGSVSQITNLPIDSNWQQGSVSQITNLPIDSNWQQGSVSQITNLPIDSNWQQGSVNQISNLPIDSSWQQGSVSQISNLPIDSNWQQGSVSQITNLPIDSNWQQGSVSQISNLPAGSIWQQGPVSQIANLPTDINYTGPTVNPLVPIFRKDVKLGSNLLSNGQNVDSQNVDVQDQNI